jgi:hypothetical protein
MGKIAKGKTMLGLTVSESLRVEIDRRAVSLNLSRSAYAGLIMLDWQKRGFPPITEADRLIQLAAKRL